MSNWIDSAAELADRLGGHLTGEHIEAMANFGKIPYSLSGLGRRRYDLDEVSEALAVVANDPRDCPEHDDQDEVLDTEDPTSLATHLRRGRPRLEVLTTKRSDRPGRRDRRLQVLLLGPLVVVDGEGLELEMPSARRVRAVLVALALRAGSVIQPRELIDTVWGEAPPTSAGKCLQTYIGVLRRGLGSTAIQTISRGYRLRVEPDDVDINRFERYVRDGSDRLARGAGRLAVDSLSAALGLWRGEALEELAESAAAMAARVRLLELRGVAEERLFEARLLLGEHEALIADLELAVRTEPFRERRWEQLMLALYRSGRQIDALEAFDRLEILLHTHRLSPGEDIRSLRMAIAARHPTLDSPVEGSR